MKHDVVAVTFDSTDGYRGFSSPFKRYHYKAPAGLLEAGDKAVVDSPSGTTVVTVREVNPTPGWGGLKQWIVCKVDRTLHERRKQVKADIAAIEATIQKATDDFAKGFVVNALLNLSPDFRRAVDILGALRAELEELGE